MAVSTARSGIISVAAKPKTLNGKEKENIGVYYNFLLCADVNKYEKVAKIGQGTYGEVFKAYEKNTKKYVALKRVLLDSDTEGFPITSLREIKILKLLKHENIVSLIEICRARAKPYNRYQSIFYLVFEFCEHDLSGLLSNNSVVFNLGEIKKVIQQLLNGLYYIHSNKILHRDMKTANILMTKTGILKVADFGLARPFSIRQDGAPNRYTNRVVTLWYRAPELLLGARNYGPPIDLWGVGCIMVEMWTRTPILKGSTEQQQLLLISKLCGTICPDVWPGVEKLDLYNKIQLPQNEQRKVRDKLKIYINDANTFDLLDKLLTLDPSKRIDADTALNHDFFYTDPMPCDLGPMVARLNKSMFELLTPTRKPMNFVKENVRSTVINGPTLINGPTNEITEYYDRVF